MSKSSVVWPIVLGIGIGVLGGCAGGEGRPARIPERVPFKPRAAAPRAMPPIDLVKPGTIARGVAIPMKFDTHDLPNESGREAQGTRSFRVGAMLGEEGGKEEARRLDRAVGEPNDLTAGVTLDESRTVPDRMFPAISNTGWNPPDPTLAVGPSHVVVTVNSDIAFYDKATGAEQFRVRLGSQGSPGFFEPEGASTFCFDPKVVYDHLAQRFVVVCLEKYGTTEAWIDIAVSDDSDPNGVWYRYRTDAVIDIGTNLVWWDYPGIGYDQTAYYITGNLFSLTTGGSFGGVGFRVFDKTPLLSGGTASHLTIRESGISTLMPMLHYGTTLGDAPGNAAAYFARIQNTTSVRFYAMSSPLTTPTLTSINVTTPSYVGAIDAPTINGTELSNAGIMMPTWRAGKVVLVTNASIDARNVARWHEFDTGSWPASGGVTRVQSGDIDAGLDYHTLFPSITLNGAGDMGVVVGRTSTSERVGVAIAGRRATDPTGRMGVPVLVKPGERDGGGRWGDYQAVVVDPADDTTFWAIGEYNRSSASGGGWHTWVASFRVEDQSLCHPVADDLGPIQFVAPTIVDVLANDWHSTGQTLTIVLFDTASALGGTITRSVGTGPGGRDELVYTPPSALPASATDSFAYTVSDGLGNTASAAVVTHLYNPANYRNPDTLGASTGGVHVDYYNLGASLTALPDFGALTPSSSDTVAQINYPSTSAAFATSGLAENVGAVFEGYVDVPATDLYTFYTNSDDGSTLSLGNTILVDNDGTHGMRELASPLIGLKQGTHRVRVEFFDAGGNQGLIVSLAGLSLAKQVIPASRWKLSVPCVADVDDGTGGGTPDGGVTIDDLLYYVFVFNLGLTRADIDNGSGTGTPDGGVTIDDLLYFLARFNAGC